MRVGLIILLSQLCGCTPYVFAGVGYAADAGSYPFDERGMLGTYGVGAKFNNYVRCEFRHRSMVDKKPEIVTNDWNCEGTLYFGEVK